MKRILLILMISLTVGQTDYAETVSGQNTQQILERIRRSEAENDRLKRELRNLIADLSGKMDASNSKINELKSRLDTSDQNVKNLNEQVGNRIASTETKTDQKLGQLDGSISRNTSFLTLGGAGLALFSVIIFLLLRRRLRRDTTGLTDNIRQTRKELEEEGIRLDGKLADILATQLEIKRRETDQMPSGSTEIDHSLALKVADEVVRIEKNLARFDDLDGKLKPIHKALGRIRDNFISNGYEMIQLQHEEFDDRMNVDVINFVTDAGLTPGKRLISKVIRPQVNFRGVMVQRAQVDVSQN